MAIYNPRHWNLGIGIEIGIGIGTDTTHAFISSSIMAMRGPHPQSHLTHRPRGQVANQKRYISTFTRPMEPKLGWLMTYDVGTHT